MVSARKRARRGRRAMKPGELEKVVKREMPGYRVARRRAPGPDAPTPPADASTPSLDELRQKYLREKYLAPDAAAEVHAGEGAAPRADKRARRGKPDEPDVIVAVEPEAPAHPWDPAARPKAIVVSGKNKKIVGKQG